MDNGESLEQMLDLLELIDTDSLTHLTKLEINGYASPEPEVRSNLYLTQHRVVAVREYIFSYYDTPDSLVVAKGQGVAWDDLRARVAATDMKYRDDVLDVLDNVPEECWRKVLPSDLFMTLVDSRQKHLMDLRGGRAYNYIYEHIFPKLRRSSITITTTVDILPMVDPEDFGGLASQDSLPLLDPPAPQQVELADPKFVPFFALKTNLLFDAASLVNAEVEFPIGDRFSVAAEWVFPWWTWDDGTSSSKRNRTQLLNGNIEGKYWFGDRTDMAVMTGWFAGLYAGGGLYDFERDAKGYQGEFFIAAGLSGGYAHTINKSGNLRMEYSLGIGYLKTDYRYYEAEYYTDDSKWHPIRQKSGTYTWVGPTRARVSLVWLINRKVEGGGKR